MHLRVPEDHPDLASAVAAASPGDVVVVSGVVTGGIRIDKPLTLTGLGAPTEPWGCVRGGGERTLILAADVHLHHLRIENPQGHGVRIEAGSAHLEALRLDVAATGVGIVGAATPTLRACVVAGCQNGLLTIGRAAPEVDDLVVEAGGGGVVVREDGAGSYHRVRVRAGRFAGIEVADAACPSFRVVEVEGNSGGIFVRDAARPRFQGVRIIRAALSGVEVVGTADPWFEDLEVRTTRGAGLLLHGSSRGTYVGLAVHWSGQSAVDVAGAAHPSIENLRVDGPRGQGVLVRGQARVEVDHLEVCRAGGVGIEVREDGWLGVDDGRLDTVPTAVVVRDRGRLLLRRVELPDGTAIEQHGEARVDRA